MSNAISGVGTTFKRWSGSAWVAIAEVKDIKGPGIKRETIEVTNLDSIGGWKEFIPGFREGGTVSLTMNFVRAGFDLMMTDFNSEAAGNYLITVNDAVKTYIEFIGYVVELPLSISPKDVVTVDVSIHVSSKLVIGSGSPATAPSSGGL